ncbi:MAG: hypothetical protein D6763_08960 [Alphaproteobacteria bacterium]|nr:MAG: hypothetical protein D6763_08960 [Alphaproteobacteria bacterium]
MTNLLPLTGPVEEPVTIAEARAYLRLDGDDDNAVVAACIMAARQACESYTGRSLISQTWQLYLDRWPEGAIILPRPPLQSVTSITVYDADGGATALDLGDFWVDSAAAPARLLAKSATVLLQPGRRLGGIEITYDAGYGDSWNDVPQALRQGILMAVANFYEHRAADSAAGLPAPIAALWQPYRVVRL